MVTFRVLSPKKYDGRGVVSELVPSRGEKKVKPLPENRILVPFRQLFSRLLMNWSVIDKFLQN